MAKQKQDFRNNTEALIYLTGQAIETFFTKDKLKCFNLRFEFYTMGYQHAFLFPSGNPALAYHIADVLTQTTENDDKTLCANMEMMLAILQHGKADQDEITHEDIVRRPEFKNTAGESDTLHDMTSHSQELIRAAQKYDKICGTTYAEKLAA